MSKSIDTLERDIEELIDEGFIPSEENLDIFVENLRELLRTRFTGYKTEGEPKTLRMSNIGKGKRQLYYDLVEDNPEERNHSADTRVKFLFGDMIEELFLFFIKEAGHTVENEQMELELDGVIGHPDCVVDGVPLDIKSASSFSFNSKFLKGGLLNDPDQDGFGYIGQISAYCKALGKDEGAFLAVDKQSGNWCVLRVDEMDMIDPEERIKEIREALDKEELPDRCYEPKKHDNGNVELHKNCFWCRHKHTCYSDANDGAGIRSFKYSNRTVDLIHVEKTPRVEEIL